MMDNEIFRVIRKKNSRHGSRLLLLSEILEGLGGDDDNDCFEKASQHWNIRLMQDYWLY